MTKTAKISPLRGLFFRLPSYGNGKGYSLFKPHCIVHKVRVHTAIAPVTRTKFQMFDKSQMIKLAITGGILFAAYRFSPNQTVKAAVLGVVGVVVAKNTPILNQYVAV